MGLLMHHPSHVLSSNTCLQIILFYIHTKVKYCQLYHVNFSCKKLFGPSSCFSYPSIGSDFVLVPAACNSMCFSKLILVLLFFLQRSPFWIVHAQARNLILSREQKLKQIGVQAESLDHNLSRQIPRWWLLYFVSFDILFSDKKMHECVL